VTRSLAQERLSVHGFGKLGRTSISSVQQRSVSSARFFTSGRDKGVARRPLGIASNPKNGATTKSATES